VDLFCLTLHPVGHGLPAVPCGTRTMSVLSGQSRTRRLRHGREAVPYIYRCRIAVT